MFAEIITRSLVRGFAGRPKGAFVACLMGMVALLAGSGFCEKLPAAEQKCVVADETKPNFKAVLSFSVPGIIEKINVKVGQKVKKGEKLAELNTSVEEAQLKQLELDANNTIRVDASKADLAQKKVDLARLVEADKKAGASTAFELEHAKLDVMIQELTVKLSEIQLEQAKWKYQEMKDRINMMKIKSPSDGIVEKRLAEPGEAATSQKEILQVVNIDPLWIEAPVPTEVAKKLKIGQTADVQNVSDLNKSDGKAKKMMGKVTNIASVADSASETLKVRVEVPNPDNQPAGQRVVVTFDVK